MIDIRLARRTARSPRTWTSKIGLVACLAIATIAPPRAFGQDMTPAASRLAPILTSSAKGTVAVVDFTDLQMHVTELGRFLAEEFQGSLVNVAKGFRVVDRTHLKAILQEHRLTATGIIDPQTARQLGKIAGVQALVTGNITPFGDVVRVSIKALDTETAHVIGMTMMDLPKTEAISLLLQKELGPGTANPPSGGSSSGSGTGASTSGTTPPAPRVQTLSTSTHQFDLLGCTRKGTNVQCDLRLINLKEDSRFRCRETGVHAYDHEGVRYRTISIEIARSQEMVVLISGVPTPATMVFGNVPSAVTAFSAFSIDCQGDAVTFRKIPIR